MACGALLSMPSCLVCGAPTDSDSRCPRCATAEGPPQTLALTPPEPAAAHAAPARPVDDSRFVPGQVLGGRFRIVALLGRGGMGEVYRAEDLRLGQSVALKFLPPALASDRGYQERFYAEVRLGRGVAHPNVCRLYDLVELEGHACLSMEYVDGEDLASLLERIGRLPIDKAGDVAREVCAGLAAAHEAGVIHRDLKPANVLFDGRGKARITDFGIATPSHAAAISELAGTPAYMAPELLEGAPASVQSDLYAYGLLLFEIYSGRPAAEARRWAAGAGDAATPTDALRAIPASVRAVIERCLAADPAARPVSARSVLTQLPGGDPLAAAVAAGETPSPAMVAAAARIGDLPLRSAWALLIATFAGLLILALLAPYQTVIGILRPDKPPEVMVERARSVLAVLGHEQTPYDWAGGYRWDFEVQGWWERERPAPERWRDRPAPIAFLYRQSDRSIVANRAPELSFLPNQIGFVTIHDPPLASPGIATLTLDPQGHLTRYAATPGPNVAPAAGEVDWSAVLAEAGFEASQLSPTTPAAIPPVPADTRMAWTGRYPDQAGPEIRVEAASFAGRPVWFEVQGPWTRPATSPGGSRIELYALWIGLLFCLAFAGPLLLLLHRHLRQGRGDRQGATRLAICVTVLIALGLLLRADHVAQLGPQYALVTNILAQATYFGLSLWATYIAVEPFARRRSPELMIGWSRLLAGRAGDPLVGREILIGAAAAVGLWLLVAASMALPPHFTLGNGLPQWQAMSAHGSLRQAGFYLILNGYAVLLCTLGTLFAYQVLVALTGRRWIALTVQFLVCATFFGSWLSGAGVIVLLVYTVLWMTLLLRIGVLAALACECVAMLLRLVSPSLDTGSWMFPTTITLYLPLAALVAWSFHTSLGGKPLFGARLEA